MQRLKIDTINLLILNDRNRDIHAKAYYLLWSETVNVCSQKANYTKVRSIVVIFYWKQARFIHIVEDF